MEHWSQINGKKGRGIWYIAENHETFIENISCPTGVWPTAQVSYIMDVFEKKKIWIAALIS